MASDSAEQDMWLFGYGSLIWKGPPHFDKRVPGYIEGYVRRFWQNSEDHRGTPEAPGRVVTLIPRAHWESLTDQHSSAPPRTWGAAYRIPARYVAEVREALDIREINGYSVDFAAFNVPVHVPLSPSLRSAKLARAKQGEADEQQSADDAPAQIVCLVYIGLPDNPQFLGPQDPDALAKHIVKSRGPSGENTEYIYNLAAALEKLREEAGIGEEEEIDEHVMDLSRRVRAEEDKLKANGAG